MSAFEHVLVLLSFIYALALTHLLTRIANLYLARERVVRSSLLAMMAANAVLVVFFDWLALWPFRSVKSWDIASIAWEFLLAIALFFMCAVVAPEAGVGTIDLNRHFERVRRPFYWLFITSNVFAMLGNLDFLKTSDSSQFIVWTVGAATFYAPPVLALAIPSRWAQWTAGLSFFVMVVAGAPILIGSLR